MICQNKFGVFLKNHLEINYLITFVTILEKYYSLMRKALLLIFIISSHFQIMAQKKGNSKPLNVAGKSQIASPKVG